MWLVEEGQKALDQPAVVTGLTLLGISLQDWVYILSLVYLGANIARLILKAYAKWRHHGRLK